jgi:hypothetical protein
MTERAAARIGWSMGAFKTERIIPATADLDLVAEDLREHFARKGFAVKVESGAACGRFVSISKGGTFKSVLGMKTALNIELESELSGVAARASVGVFGQQAVPTALMLFVAWPVILTQAWGLVQQSKLDDEAIDVAERSVLARSRTAVPGSRAAADYAGAGAATGAVSAVGAASGPASSGAAGAVAFCTECGARIPESARFCGQCGTKRA